MAQGSITEDLEFKITVDKDLVGLVIGTNGKNIKRIEVDTGARITNKKAKGSNIFYVRGSKKQCDLAMRRIEEIQQRTKKQPKRMESKPIKLLSFITSLKGENLAAFSEYKGPTPPCWIHRRNAVMFYLTSVEKEQDMINPPDCSIERMRNYSHLEDTIRDKMMELLGKGGPLYIELEIRFGKVLWLSESKNAPSDEVLFQKHQIKDLEQNGAVSVDRFLGRTKWSFVTEIPDPTVLGIQLSGNPIIGEAEMININYRHTCEGPNSRRQIRVRCTGPTGHQPVFELLEVKSFEAKDIVYDCLYLEGHLDMRVVLSHSDVKEAEEDVCREWGKKVFESVTFDVERDRINFYGHPSNYEPEFIRHVYQKLYLVPHNKSLYILAHYEVTECDCQGSKGPYNLGNSHQEFELWNVQWMADFALLKGIDWREEFTLNNCDVSQLGTIRPKNIEIATFLKELQDFTQLALQIM